MNIQHFLLCQAFDDKDECTIAIYNSGGIKYDILPGEITMKKIKNSLPYKNKINMIKIPGSTLKDILNHSAESFSKGGFLQVLNEHVYSGRSELVRHRGTCLT